MNRKATESVPLPEEGWVEAVRRKLLNWYDENKRELPWRQNKDPYRIWVSEIMLQQTRVDTVIPYYERFMESFPTLNRLAEAEEESVIKAWEGLGYYSRARNLHTAVKEVAATYGGEIPRDPEEISSLKGVGNYTAGAILSIAYDQPVPAVDGNVMRVFSRWFALQDDVAKLSTRRKMETIARHVISEERPGDFNQALMELGALVCSPLSPSCDICPVQEHCQARKEGVQAELPVKKKAKPPVPSEVSFGYIRHGDRILIQRRPKEGLLAGMWGLPSSERKKGEVVPGETLKQDLFDQGLEVELGAALGEMEHVFSHRRWWITVVEGELPSPPECLPEGYEWVKEGEWDTLALPNVYRKALERVADRSRSWIQGRLF
ncbi:A/G-specific adenine glycosylase [Paludifilum halophilum]|uniref:Adenine DNA glycosylase n=1 Tax=Paludifilum halophilum TaxID=1642702 RepID=A0A235B4W1_9BACL|nr:A/G-specific adenine glycosylase [Paludifilum halophilum]OYD06999.1 A/G-specific adenine glycosylase [Paludifilum halophilum]